jgi:hypothetical protein
MDQMIHSYNIYPIDKERPRDAKVFYRELMKNHDGKIPVLHCSDREFTCGLFLCDVKIRAKLKEFITVTPAKEKLLNLFF